MPVYEYRCPECDATFERRRTMAEADEPVLCPDGHVGSRRLLSVFAAVGTSSASAPAGSADAPPAGPCGGSCACYPG